MYNPHFVVAESIDAAEKLLTFRPSVPAFTAECRLDSIAVFVMDHQRREVPAERRSVELHYGRFAVSQQAPGPDEARRLALEVPYGRMPMEIQLPGGPGRAYELGPPVPPDDLDGRAPAVVVWASGDRFHLLASSELEHPVLMDIAGSIE